MIHFFPNSWDLNKKVTHTVNGKDVAYPDAKAGNPAVAAAVADARDGDLVGDGRLEEAVADRLQPLTFMDLDWRIVNRQLDREALMLTGDRARTAPPSAMWPARASPRSAPE